MNPVRYRMLTSRVTKSVDAGLGEELPEAVDAPGDIEGGQFLACSLGFLQEGASTAWTARR